MIAFAHTKFGLVWIKGSGVKRGAGSAPPQPERVFEIPAWIGLTYTGMTLDNLRPRYVEQIFIFLRCSSY